MADIFDQITGSNGDIFDQITPPKQGDIFDKVAPEAPKTQSKTPEKKQSNDDYFYDESTGRYWKKGITPQETLAQLAKEETLPARQLVRGSIAGKYLTDIPEEERSGVMEMIGSGPELLLSRGGGAIPGAMAGAAAGSMFGPVGTAVGGAIGGFTGGVGGMTAYETGKRYVEGEEISLKQIAKDAASFAAWEGAFAAVGKVIRNLKTSSAAKQLVAEMAGMSEKDATELIKSRAADKKLKFVDAAKDFLTEAQAKEAKAVERMYFEEGPSGKTSEKIKGLEPKTPQAGTDLELPKPKEKLPVEKIEPARKIEKTKPPVLERPETIEGLDESTKKFVGDVLDDPRFQKYYDKLGVEKVGKATAKSEINKKEFEKSLIKEAQDAIEKETRVDLETKRSADIKKAKEKFELSTEEARDLDIAVEEAKAKSTSKQLEQFRERGRKIASEIPRDRASPKYAKSMEKLYDNEKKIAKLQQSLSEKARDRVLAKYERAAKQKAVEEAKIAKQAAVEAKKIELAKAKKEIERVATESKATKVSEKKLAQQYSEVENAWKNLEKSKKASKVPIPKDTKLEVTPKERKIISTAKPKEINILGVLEPKETPKVTPQEKVRDSKVGKFFEKAKNFINPKDKNQISKETWKLIETYAGEKSASKYTSLVKRHGDLKARFPKDYKSSDALAYREKTGNIYKGKEDTFKDVESRLSPEFKDYIDNELPKDFEEVEKSIAADPLLKNINARDFVKEIYIPHFFEGKAKDPEVLLRRFKTDLPMNNMRKLATYHDAFTKAGLTPKYDNLPDMMHAYDQLVTRSRINTHLVNNIENLEKNLGEKLILRSSDEGYTKAKDAGYIQFDDPYLKKGSPAPALVHPDLAKAVQSVFHKELPKAPGPFIQFLRDINDISRVGRVSLSKFHHRAIIEGYSAATNTKEALKMLSSPRDWASKADAYLNNREFAGPAVEAGLEVHPTEGMEVPTNRILNKLKLKEGLTGKAATVVEKGLNAIDKVMPSPHKKFIPRVKIMTYAHILEDAMAAEMKQTGKAVTETRLKEIRKSVAHTVNNWFGGQRFENIAHMNDPQLRRKIRDFIAYPDWSISTLREVQDMFSKDPIVRKYAQRYGAKYMAQLFTRAQIKSMAYTGLYNKPDGSISWSWDKAHPTWKNDDPTKDLFQVQLPDVNLKVPGIDKTINIGRDDKGRRRYSSEGKKFREIKGWLTHPMKELYSKTSPGFQAAVEQLLGQGLSSDIPIYPEYKRGKMVPWEGTEFGSLKNLKLRLQHLGSNPMPFSLRSLFSEGLEHLIASEFGTATVSKGASTYSMQDYIKKALKNNDNKKLQQYIKVLKDEGYTPDKIQRVIANMRTEIRKENNK